MPILAAFKASKKLFWDLTVYDMYSGSIKSARKRTFLVQKSLPHAPHVHHLRYIHDPRMACHTWVCSQDRHAHFDCLQSFQNTF
jgi:hypothetical protein